MRQNHLNGILIGPFPVKSLILLKSNCHAKMASDTGTAASPAPALRQAHNVSYRTMAGPTSRQDQLARACDQQKAPAQRELAGPSLRSLNAHVQKAGILGCLRPATKVEVM